MPTPVRSALSGDVAALAGLSAAHLVAALTDPATSPVVSVGSTVIDLTPTPLKEWAIRQFGTKDELAFYDAVAENESAVQVQGDDVLAQIARDLVGIMQRDVRTDWTVRDDVRAAPDRWARVLDATFPPASVSGAPKSSALRIISALETAAGALSRLWHSVQHEPLTAATAGQVTDAVEHLWTAVAGLDGTVDPAGAVGFTADLARQILDYWLVDTLRDLRAIYGPDVELYFITGADALEAILSWKDPETMFGLAHFVGVTRPGYKLSAAHLPQDAVSLVEVPAMAISSSDCRRRVSEGKPVWYLVPDGVVQYIVKHDLYLMKV